MIGELINRFDNETQGTVEEFNELFPFAKLKSGKYVEILEPVVGKEIVRILNVDGKEFEHSFRSLDHKERAKIDYSKRKKPEPRRLYVYEATDGQDTKQFYSLQALADFLGRSQTSIWDRLNRGYSKVVDGWTISQTKIGDNNGKIS